MNDFPEDLDKIDCPFKLYDSQKELIKSCLRIFDNKEVGIVESPTGSGKTLSILYSSIKWLRKNRIKLLISQMPHASSTAPKWIRENIIKNREDDACMFLRENEEQIKIFEANGVKLKKEIKDYNSTLDVKNTKFLKSSYTGKCLSIYSKIDKKKAETEKKTNFYQKSSLFQQEDFNLEEENAGYSSKSNVSNHLRNNNSINYCEVNELKEKDCEDLKKPQIIICSRTHLQLQQYIHEIKKMKFENYVKVVCVASRKQLCVNPEVTKRAGSLAQINEMCKILNDKSKCQYKESSHKVVSLALEELLDIEDLIKHGAHEIIEGCPYYGARFAAKYADILLMPYNSILSQTTREMLGLNISYSVIILDEAHNLSDAICNAYSSTLTFSQLESCLNDLTEYHKTYCNRMTSKNLFLLNQLIKICQIFLDCLKEAKEAKSFTVPSFLIHLKMQNFNLHILNRWLCDSGIRQKIRGFSLNQKIKKMSDNKETFFNGNEKSANYKNSFAVYSINDFIEKLVCSAPSDFVLIYPFFSTPSEPSAAASAAAGKNVCLKEAHMELSCFLPQKHFASLVEECYSLLLIGGTMEPRKEFISLCEGDNSKILESKVAETKKKKNIFCFTASHIVPKSQIFCAIVSCDKNGNSLDFSFNNRRKENMINALIDFIFNASKIVPGGIVIFFSSFEYLNYVSAFFLCKEKKVRDEENSEKISMRKKIAQIQKRKKIFVESQNSQANSGLNENILRCYSKHIEDTRSNRESMFGANKNEEEPNDANTGAVLMSVIGGKLSEGINFSDDLARCVIIVGLPYPNKSFQLQKKLEFLDGYCRDVSLPSSSSDLNFNENEASRETAKSDSTNDMSNAECINSGSSGGPTVSGVGNYRDNNASGGSCGAKRVANFKSNILSGNELLNTICFKKVNQSIGRAIRHKNDFAGIILFDKRFANSNIIQYLPSWIRNNLLVAKSNLLFSSSSNDASNYNHNCLNYSVSFDNVMSSLSNFFREKTQKLTTIV